MNLNKAQINALVSDFCKKKNAGYDAAKKAVDENRRAMWDKTADGRLYAKLPKWMKDSIRDWALNEQINKLAGAIKLPPKVEACDVEREIIIASIGAEGVAEIRAALEKKFKQ